MNQLLKINPEKYAKQLVDKWDAEIIPDRYSELTWKTQFQNDNVLQGWLLPNKVMIAIDGTTRHMAVFTIWHREITYPNQPLYLLDRHGSVNFEITGSTSVSDIENEIKRANSYRYLSS